MIGLISDRDLRMSMLEMEQGPAGAPKGYYLPALTKVHTVMIANVLTASPDMALANAVTVMSERKIGCLPVVDSTSKKPIGIVTETDMLRLLARMLKGQSQSTDCGNRQRYTNCPMPPAPSSSAAVSSEGVARSLHTGRRRTECAARTARFARGNRFRSHSSLSPRAHAYQTRRRHSIERRAFR